VSPDSVCDKEVLVERFGFDADVAFTPRDELLERVTIAPLSAPISERSHEVKTTGGLTALIIEGRDLDRFRRSA
jgi:hypothetical protein